jgi:hypothetical protein
MRRSPPLRAEVRSQPRLQIGVTVLAGLAGVAAVLALEAHLRGAWMLVAAVPGLAVMAWRSAALRPRVLRWDGQDWWLAPDTESVEVPVRLKVVIDLDHWLLVQALPAGPGRHLAAFLAFSRASQGATWGALRATLHAARAAEVPA